MPFLETRERENREEIRERERDRRERIERKTRERETTKIQEMELWLMA